MGFEVPIYILIGISVVFYLAGSCSPALVAGGFCEPIENLTGSVGVSEPAAASVLTALQSIFTDPVFLGLIGLATVSTFLLGGNFTINYIIPIFMIVVIMNFFILPISFIFTTTFDPFLKILFALMLNSMLILTIVEFVRR